MLSLSTQRRLVKILFAVALLEILLLLATSLFKEDEILKSEFEMSGFQIDSTLQFIFDEFNLIENNLQKKKVKNFGNDSLVFSYSIILPQDISPLKFLEYTNEVFPKEKVIFETREAEINKRMSIGFYSAGYLKAFLEIKYDNQLTRNVGETALILTGLELEDSSEIAAISIEPENLTLLFPPSEKIKRMSEIFSASGKSYELLLTTNINELKYKVDPKYSNVRLKASVANLRNDFPAKNIIIADEEISENKIFYNSLLKIFRNVKFDLIPIGEFISYSNLNEFDKQQKFNLLYERITREKKLILIFNPDELNETINIARRLKMRGIKVKSLNTLQFNN